MSDRLNELRRLRALAQEQVAWFDREIARESGGATPAAAPLPTAAPAPAPVVPPAAPRMGSVSPLDAEKLIERYREKGRPVKDEVRRGCFMYFFAAFAILGLGLVAWYFARMR